MVNRAKCKLCQTILQTKHPHDYVTCNCGEITIGGGNEFFRAKIKSKENFLIIDDEGNEIVPKDKVTSIQDELPKPSKEDLLEILDDMYKRIEDLPMNAALAPITHADFAALIMLLSAIFKKDK
jgi:hypothetical protein